MRKRFYGKWKKMCAAVLAAGMLVTSCPTDVFAAAVGENLENGCLKVYDRKADDGGVAFDLSGQLTEGEEYTVSAKIMYIGGADERTLRIWFENKWENPPEKEGGGSWNFWEFRAQVGQDIKVKKGEWTTFSADYTAGKSQAQAPFGSHDNKLFFETPNGTNDLADYYIDDVVVTKKTDGTTLLNQSFDANEEQAIIFGNAKIQWVKEGDEVLKEDEKPSKERDPENGCLKALNRTSEDGGAGFNLNNLLSTGKTYTISANVLYLGGAAERQINMTIQAGSDWQYRTGIADVKAKKGEWTEVKTTTYQPGTSDHKKEFDATNVKLFFETPNGTKDFDDFYIDDVVVAENDGDSILNVSFDDDADIDVTGATVKKVSAFSNAQIKWVKEGEEAQKEDENPKKDRNPDNGCLGVLNRTAEGNGVGFKVDGLVKDGQTTYTVSAQVIYLGGDNTRTINMTIQGGADWTYRKVVKAITAKQGEWVSARVTDYILPEKGDGGGVIDPSNVTLFFETPNNSGDIKDFYIDDVIVKKNGEDAPLLSEDFETEVGSAKVFPNVGAAEIQQMKESEIKEIKEDPQYHPCIEGTTLVSGALKSEDNNTHVNPLFDYKMGADPYAITYNGRVYVYMTNDSQHWEKHKNEYGYPNLGNNFEIDTLNVFSSADMVNWTDHGEISIKGKGTADKSWAPAVCHKEIDGKDKFFLYFANGGNGIYVLESDSPIGPFEAPATGSALITRTDSEGQTTQQSDGVEWLFDPAVLVDDDEKHTGYLYYGGGVPEGKADAPGTIRVVRLKDNMVQVDGEAETIDAPGAFEDSGIHKYNGKYYYTYCSNFTNNLETTGRGNICAMVSDNPMTGFTYAGIVFENPEKYFGVGGNNHHCFFEFNGKSYFTYHAQTLAKALGFNVNGSKQSGFRSTHIDDVAYGENGNIVNIIGTREGSEQVKDLNPYERVEAETIAWSKGIKADTCTEDGFLVKGLNMMVTEITGGDYLAVSNADFGDGSSKFSMHVAGLAGGTVELHLDGTKGPKVGEVQVSPGDGTEWTDVSCEADVSGKHNLYLTFKGGEGQLMYADYWKFDEKPVRDKLDDKIKEANEMLEDLSEDKKAALNAAITEAAEAFNKADASDMELEDALKKLKDAINEARKDKPTAAQKQDMTDKITEAETLLTSLGGTKKEALQTAIANAKAALENTELTKEQFAQEITDLQAAINEAKKQDTPGDNNNPTDAQKQDMNTRIATAEALLNSLSGEKKEALQTAITNAKAALENKELTKEQFGQKITDLQNAIDAAKKPDTPDNKPTEQQKQDMNTKITEAEGMLKDLEGTDKQNLETAIANAKAALANTELTKEQFGQKITDLQNAIDTAKEVIESSKPVKEQLTNKIQKAKELLDKLSDAEKAKLQGVIDEVEETLNKEGATDEEIQAALDKLKAAFDEAEETTKPVQEQLSNKITAAKAMLDKLSDAQKQKLQAVIDEVEATLNKEGATDEEIQAALDKLNKAIEDAEKPDQTEEEKPSVNETFTSKDGQKFKVTSYKGNNKYVTVTGTSKQLTGVTVPDTIAYKGETFKVTAIADLAFANQKNLKSAVIGKNVTKIGKKAFYNCKNLAKVTFKGTAVKTIGKDAFKSIKKNASFKMTKNTFTSKNLKYKVTKCTTSVKEVTVTGASKKTFTSLSIPATVNYNGMTFKVAAVNKKAFKNYSKLKNVTVGKNVGSIGASAFEGCKKLAKIKFSGTALKSIGKNAFKNIKKNAAFSVKISKKASYKKLLTKAKTKNFKVK